MGLSIKLGDVVANLMEIGNLSDITASVHNNLDYILPLEGLTKDGLPRVPHSEQAPDGMVRKNQALIEAMLIEKVNAAFDKFEAGADLQTALEEAVTSTINFALTTIVADTPIDTGRAMGAWLVTGVDGTTTEETPGTRPSKWKDRAFVNAHLKAKRAQRKAAKTREDERPKRKKGRAR